MKMFQLGRVAPMVLAAGLLVAGCGKSKEEQQIEALTLEIQQIEDQKNNLQTQLDSVSKIREGLLTENEAQKADITKLTESLATANSAAAVAKRRSNELLAQLNQWKDKAEKLAAENAQLKDRITTLTARLEEAERKVAEAEARAEAAEAKIRELEGRVITKSYYVQRIDVRGYNGSKEFSRERIKANADKLVVDMAISRPAAPAPDLGPLPLRLEITGPKGQVFYSKDITVDGSNASVTIDIKGEKLDLDKGRHNIKVTDLKDNSTKFESFFLVQSSFL